MLNLEQQRKFIQQNLHNQTIVQIYKRLGYTIRDLQQIQLSHIAKQSEINDLDIEEREYYIKRKYETMVLRRGRIIQQVYNQYTGSVTKNKNYASNHLLQNRTLPKVRDQLESKQLNFFEKEQKYYSKVAKMKEKKINEVANVQQNSYINSSHYKTLMEKKKSKSSLAESDTSKSRSNPKNQSASQNRRQRIKQFMQECEKVNNEKRKLLDNKLVTDREKVQRVYENLRNITKKRKMKSQIATQIAKSNLIEIQNYQKQQLKKKKLRIKAQMEKYQNNRKRQLLKREQQLQSQKKLFLKREAEVQEYQTITLERERQRQLQQHQQKMKKMELNKKLIDEIKKSSIEQISLQKREKQKQANKIKQDKLQEKMKKNIQTYEIYTQNLKKALERKTRKDKQIKIKLLDQRIKQQIAKKNLEVQKRLQSIKKLQIVTKRNQKKTNIQQLLNMKDKLVTQRRVYLGKTLKKLQFIDKQFNNRTMVAYSNRPTTSQDISPYASSKLTMTPIQNQRKKNKNAQQI